MRKYFCQLFFISFCFSSTAQSVDLSGGINRNSYFSYQNFNPKYKSADGFFVGVGVQDILIDSIPFRFTFSLVNYGGEIYTVRASSGGGTSTSAEINKYNIELGIYPLNFKLIAKKLQVNIGAEFCMLINETTTGYSKNWSVVNPLSAFPVNGSINNYGNVGIVCRLGYEIKIKSNWFLIPHYMFYWGLTDEFKVEVNTKSFRSYFGIGILRQFKKVYFSPH